jgi:hypothetical protein
MAQRNTKPSRPPSPSGTGLHRRARTSIPSKTRVPSAVKVAADQLLISWALRALVSERQAQHQHAAVQR